MRSNAANARQKTGMRLIEEHVPDLYSLRSIAYMLVCFLVPFIPTHLINSISWWSPLISAVVWNALAFYLMSRISRNAESIRRRYLARYGDQAYRHFFYRYVVPVASPCMIAFLMILAVENSRFVRPLYSYNHALYRTLSPWWVFVPVGLLLFAFSAWAMRPSINGGFDRDTELFLYIIHPEKSFPLRGGTYTYVRHAHYAEGIWMGIGAAFLAQNWMGFLMAFMLVFSYYGIAHAEDRELVRRYGVSFQTTIRGRPKFFPRLRDLGGLVRLVVSGR